VADLLATLPLDDQVLVAAIVLARLALPLLIPRVPLVILAALVLDAADQTILQTFTELDTTETGPYQGFDKALDIYYLAIAYLATMRNWTSDAAFRISQFLFYYRLLGVMLFELLDSRLMLLIFPNTFEYFFIAYEVIRLRFDPSRVSARFWLLTAAGLWVFVKLPQEYWIHIAQRDMTDTIAENPAVGVVMALGVIVLHGVAQFVVRPRLPEPAWGWRFASDPLIASVRDAHERYSRRLRRGRVVWGELAEKVALLGLLGVIFASVIPNVEAPPLQVAFGVVLIVGANTAISMRFALSGRAGGGRAVGRFAALVVANLALVFLGHSLLAGDSFQLGTGLFFAGLITLILWLFDVYRPIYDARFDSSPLGVTSVADFVHRVKAATP
jgi:hypothetical protein